MYEIVQHEEVHANTSSYHNILGRTRSYSTRSAGTMECSRSNILKSTVPVRDRDRTSRRSARKCGFVPQYTVAYAVVQHEECRIDGVQQYQYTKGTVFVRDRDRTARKSACRYELYHNILGRTRSYSTRSAGTMECSSTNTLKVLFPYAIVQHYREYANTGHECCLLYTSPSPRDGLLSRMPSSA